MQQRHKPTPPRTTRAAEIRKQQAKQNQSDTEEGAGAGGIGSEATMMATAGGAGTTTKSFPGASSTFNANSSSSVARQQQLQQRRQNALTPSASANAAATNLQLQSFEAVLSLMKNPATAEQFDRHASQLASLVPHLLAKPSIPARLVDPSSALGGLPALLMQIAEVVSTNEAAAVLGDALVQLLELASFPIQCSTLYDQRSQPSCVVALLEAVSHALCEPHTLAIRTQAATVMRDIIRRVNDKCGIDLRGINSGGGGSSGGGSSSISRTHHNTSTSSSNRNVSATTGSAIQDLRAAVTRRSVLALADAWRASIEREIAATIEYARASSFKKQGGDGGGDGEGAAPAPASAATGGGPTPDRSSGAGSGGDQNNSNTDSNNNNDSTSVHHQQNVTVEGISQQLQQRDAALEVVALLQALNAVTSVRTRANWLLEAGADQLIFGTLKLSNGDPRTALCVELLWNLLQLCRTNAAFFATRDSYDVLNATLRITVQEGHVAARRELRNDILVVFGLLTDASPDSQCVSASLVNLVLELACGVELGLSSTVASGISLKNHHTTRNEDMQLKILGWDLLRRWCVADEELAEIAFSSRYLDALLCYIDVTCENTAVVAWSTPQLLELQEHSLRILEELVRVGCAWFCVARGPTICVSYVLECPAKPASLLQRAISLLAEAASSPARKLVVENGAIPLALRLLSSVPLCRETIERHVDCLTLIADLVDRTEQYQAEFANNNGVEIIIPLLKGAVDFADLGDELMLAAVDCVWGCVLGLERSEQQFCDLGGVGAMLAILDTRKVLQEAKDAKVKTLAASIQATRFPGGGIATTNNNNSVTTTQQDLHYHHHAAGDENNNDEHMPLGGAGGGAEGGDADDPLRATDEEANFPLACIADLLLCPGASDLARKWRSPTTGRSGMQVLLSLWKMQKVPNEIITERGISEQTAAGFDVGCAVLGRHTRNPLPIGEADERSKQEQPALIPTHVSDPSYVARAGIVVPAPDVRAIATAFRQNLKVFSAIASVGYTGHHELELEERATLTTIQQFVALCKDEVWETVSNSLLSAGVEPTNADWETLRMLREAAEQRASSLQATRAAFAEMHRRQREIAERTFYEALIKRTEQRFQPGRSKSRGGGTGPTSGAGRGAATSGRGAAAGGEGGDAADAAQNGGGGDRRQVGFDAGTDMTPAVTSNMSITEAKKLNKQMLKSSFKYPVSPSAAKKDAGGAAGGGGEDDAAAAGGGGGEDALKQALDAVRRRASEAEEELAGSRRSNASTDADEDQQQQSSSTIQERWGVGQRAMSEDEYAIFKAINSLRTNPKAFVPTLENALARYDHDAGHIEPAEGSTDDPMICEEGTAAIQEAIDFLNKVRPLAVLLDVPLGMLLASRDFVKAAEKRMDNIADDTETTPVQRMERYGKLEGKQMQLVSLGCSTPESVVVQLVVGDGNPERPDRTALFNPEFRCCSAALAEHPVYKKVVQISLAAGYNEKPQQQQKAAHASLWAEF